MTIENERDMDMDLRLLEAILFAQTEPVTEAMLLEQMGEGADLLPLLKKLQEDYAARGVNLVETGGIWSFRTAEDLIGRLKITKQPRRKLPRAASEVLAIIAYHQPVTRGDIESIRGVETSRGTLDLLLELGWIRPGKRREVPGRPLTWKTTPDFLSHFNLGSLTELPGMDDLKAAGLLDARPVLANVAMDKESGNAAAEPEEDDFSEWVEDEVAG
jgi:segregation and condensation protein B